MTSPVELHVMPNCGLKIIPKLLVAEEKESGNHDLSRDRLRYSMYSVVTIDEIGGSKRGFHGKHALSYTVEDIEKQGFPVALNEEQNQENGENVKKDFTGVMSPLSPLSLPKQRKKQAGIDDRATRFAYIHPPRGLAGALDWAAMKVVWKQLKYHDRKMNNSDYEDDGSSFDDGSGCIAYSPTDSEVNIGFYGKKQSQWIGRKKSSDSAAAKGKLFEPLIVPPSQKLIKKWSLACFSLLGAFAYFQDKEDGVEVISVNALCLSKLGSKGGLRMAGPFETPLQTIQILKKLNRFETIPLENFHECGFVAKAWLCPLEKGSSHGSMIFLRDDNTALTYNIKSGGYALKSGSRSILADLIDPYELDFKMIMGQKFVTDYVTYNDDESFQLRYLQHFPCWSPLHYSCRFKTNDIESIRALKTKYADSVGNLDRFNRSLLHLACESATVTGEAIRELLDNNDDTITNRLLYCKTKCCKRLPLHTAINNGAPKEVIEELLKKSKMRRMYLERTSDGRLPIHLAIERMADKSVIELLLNVDPEKETLYDEFKGMLPLHIACWNGHCDAIPVLLRYDNEGKSIHHDLITAKYLKFNSKLDYMTFNDNNEAVIVSFTKKTSKRLTGVLDFIGGNDDHDAPWVRALHIALLKCSDEISAKITKLLLQKEYSHIHSEEGEVTVNMTDSAGRNPLMLACMQNAEDEIIKSLINLDQTKSTVAQVDRLGNTALHHLCEHKTVRASTVQLLLDTEDEYYSSSIENSTNKINNQKMTPLKLAIRAGAATEVLEILLDSERINMRDFDDQIIRELSMRVKGSKRLQESINHKLSDRHPCFNLMISLVYRAIVYQVFLMESNEYLTGGFGDYRGNQVFLIATPILLGYLFVEIIKEMHEFIGQGLSYLYSKKNFIDLTRMALVLVSLEQFFIRKVVGNEFQIGRLSYFLSVTTFLLGLDIILALRAAFLPFAKFAGGLTAILRTLIPFFIVSVVFLLCFTNAFRVDAVVIASLDDAVTQSNIGDMSADDICATGFNPCLQMVFKAFFTGEYESNSWLYLGFGLIVILILLTIVIAIVSDAWDGVENKATEYYWESRITFLYTIQSPILQSSTSPHAGKYITDIVNKVAAWIDDFGYIDIFNDEQKKSWTRDAPYNLVAELEQYYKPYDYFEPSVARVIKKAHSPRSEFYWISQKKEGLEKKKAMIISGIKWSAYTIAYMLLIVLGFLTGGFFWPEGFRRFVLSYGYESLNNESENQTDSSKSDQREAHTYLESSTKNEMVTAKKSNIQFLDDCFIEIMNSDLAIAQKMGTKEKLQLIADKLGVKLEHD